MVFETQPIIHVMESEKIHFVDDGETLPTLRYYDERPKKYQR